MFGENLPYGKLSPSLLNKLINQLPTKAEELLLGPGIGLDCAVLRTTGGMLVFKSDPITFATDEIGWYLVQVNVNDIATTGAIPRWMLVTMLLPQENGERLACQIADQLRIACETCGLTIIGGHSEVTLGIDRPILAGTVIGEVSEDKLVTPKGAQPGDRLLITKGVPVEATAILSREFSDRLLNPASGLNQEDLDQGCNFLHDPGISILTDARMAIKAGGVHAMHDPTEGGVYAALWEMVEACGHSLCVATERIPVYPLSARICQVLGLDPLGVIASGALLIAAAPEASETMISTIQQAGIRCVDIGFFIEADGKPTAWEGPAEKQKQLPRQPQDEITRLFQNQR